MLCTKAGDPRQDTVATYVGDVEGAATLGPMELQDVTRAKALGLLSVPSPGELAREEHEKENPKYVRALKEGKAPLEYLLLSLAEGDARTHKHGADKYGICNWRKDPIKASTYKAAILRHLKAYFEDGEDLDPDSGQNHMYHIRCCAGILLDAEQHGTLIDDRVVVESKGD